MIKEFILKLVNYLPFGRLISSYYFLQKNHLSKSGWKRSVVHKLPVDRNGNALPWLTYSSINFLTGRLQKSFSVFEYGSGNSTIWFSTYVNEIISIEHDKRWFDKLDNGFKNIPNITYEYRDLATSSYQNEILNFTNKFDIIVIDGRQRIACSLNSLKALKKDGVILWDNSDRDEYQKGYNYFLNSGFKRLDFYGMGPVSAHSWCTSIFYRKDNCLNI
jgi:hypothetical protein